MVFEAFVLVFIIIDMLIIFDLIMRIPKINKGTKQLITEILYVGIPEKSGKIVTAPVKIKNIVTYGE